MMWTISGNADSRQGGQVPLYLLADVEILEGPNQIQRENARGALL
jgi:Cu/Ag efflux pump CusA